MKIEIDQSGKIEQTNLDTVIALSNKVHISVLLKKKDKRILERIFREKRKVRIFKLETFAALTATIFQLYNHSSKVIIDQEYKGHEGFIKAKIIRFCQKLKITNIPLIDFRLIGKGSSAHQVSLDTLRKKKKATRTIKIEEINKLIFEH